MLSDQMKQATMPFRGDKHQISEATGSDVRMSVGKSENLLPVQQAEPGTLIAVESSLIDAMFLHYYEHWRSFANSR
jgi:hypothetical protein